jgi:hypothetical protein
MPFRASAEGKRNQAVQKLPVLEEELTTAILKNSALILVSNKAQNATEFVEYIKSKEAKLIVLDYLSLDKRLFQGSYRGIKTTNGYSFNTETYSRINAMLYDIGIELGIRTMPHATTDARLYGVVKTDTEALNKIGTVINSGAGADYVRQLYLNKQLRDQVLLDLDYASVAIIMVNVPDDSMGAMGPLAGRAASVYGEDSESNGITLSGNSDSDFDSVIEAIRKTFVKNAKKT